MRFAIIGCGSIAKFYADAIKEMPGSCISDVFDVNRTAGEKFAEEQHAVYHSDYEELLVNGSEDAVCICTPSGLHADLAVKASEAGKHVVCEKPIGITLEQLDAISAACEKNGTKFGAITQMIFTDSIQKVKKCMEEGRLGKILLCDLSMKYYRTKEYYANSGWRGTFAMDGGGALMNQGIHGIALMLYLMGEVKTVSAYARTLVHDIEVEDTSVASMEFANGALGSVIATTSLSPSFPRKLCIHGSKGFIEITEEDITRWEVEGEDAFTQERTAGDNSSDPTKTLSGELHRLQLTEFVDAVEHGRKPMLDETFGRKPVELILGIYRSSEQNRQVTLPLAIPDFTNGK